MLCGRRKLNLSVFKRVYSVQIAVSFAPRFHTTSGYRFSRTCFILPFQGHNLLRSLARDDNFVVKNSLLVSFYKTVYRFIVHFLVQENSQGLERSM